MRLFLLGATGNIGMQTLDIVRNSNGRFVVVSVAVNKSINKLKAIIDEFHPLFVSVGIESVIPNLQKDYQD